MNPQSSENRTQKGLGVLTLVLLFWVGYVAITLLTGFVTSSTIQSETWQLTAWGFISSAGLLVLVYAFSKRNTDDTRAFSLHPQTWWYGKFTLGLVLGVASFGVHVVVVSAFAGPVRFEAVAGVGVLTVLLFSRDFWPLRVWKSWAFGDIRCNGSSLSSGFGPRCCSHLWCLA